MEINISTAELLVHVPNPDFSYIPKSRSDELQSIAMQDVSENCRGESPACESSVQRLRAALPRAGYKPANDRWTNDSLTAAATLSGLMHFIDRTA